MAGRFYEVSDMNRCAAMTKRNAHCRRPKESGRDFCQLHKDTSQRFDGKANPQPLADKVVTTLGGQLPANFTERDLGRLSGQAAIMVMEGRISPSQADAVSKLVTSGLKAIKEQRDDDEAAGGAEPVSEDPYGEAPQPAEGGGAG